jgi:NitT/TauT family transport system permease protein
MGLSGRQAPVQVAGKTSVATSPLTPVRQSWRALLKDQLWGINAKPSFRLSILLGVIPFIVLILIYVLSSDARLIENPQDKLLPSFTQMAQAFGDMAFEVDVRTGRRLLWLDTGQSLIRIGLGVTAAALAGLFCGLHLGVFAQWRAGFLPLATFVSIVPPLALLPILFIVFGVDEFAKVALIFLGVFPVMTRDIFGAVSKLPVEQRTKSQTLGASGLSYLYMIVLPQVLPRLVETTRLSMGSAWLFLIASEAIAAEAGLGYRIFLVRRYLSMDIIVPYALWITLIGFTLDWLLKKFNSLTFKWYTSES